MGYHSLHPDVSLNFQMNRWFGWVGEPEMLVEMRSAAQRIANHVDWKREFLELATTAFQRGHLLRAAFYWRSAEFFMRPDDSDRAGARDGFLETIRSVYVPELADRHAVPYAHQQRRGFLPACRFEPAQPSPPSCSSEDSTEPSKNLWRAFCSCATQATTSSRSRAPARVAHWPSGPCR